MNPARKPMTPTSGADRLHAMNQATLPDTPSRWPLTLLVIVLHLLLFALLQSSRLPPRETEAREARRITVALLPAPAPRLLKDPQTPTAAPRPARPLPQARHRAEPAPVVPTPPDAPPPRSAEVPQSLALPSAPAAASSPERLIDSAATRSALRQAAREPLSAERHLAAQGQESGVSASEKLGRKVQQAGYGDCSKGQYAGGGMGLLSAPFYLLAEASGKCAKGNPPPAGPPPPPPSGRNGAHASMHER